MLVDKKFILAYISRATIDRSYIFHMCIFCDKTFLWVHNFDIVTLKFDLHLKNVNLGHSFLTRGRAFIFHMWILVVRPFMSYHEL